MTDKQFTTKEEVLNQLNKLYEESQDLATKKEDAEYELLYLKEEYEELLKENEQLKAQLYCDSNIKLNNFKKKVFELINKRIKHYQHEPISAPVMQPLSINFDHEQDRLARLSELQQLLKELEE